MIPKTVTLSTWTGDEAGPNGPSMDELRRRLWEKLDADHPGLSKRLDNPDDHEAKKILREAGQDFMHGFFIARAHRDAAPLANEYAEIDSQAIRAVQQADSDYADLSKNTTVNWLAAHHRFVLSTQNARDLLEQRVQMAEGLLEHRRFLTDDDLSTQIYARFVPAEHRITMPDLDAAKLQLANFVEISTERFAATRATITGGYPEGFAPAPIETDEPQRADDDEIIWINTTFPSTFDAAPAIVAGSRNW